MVIKTACLLSPADTARRLHLSAARILQLARAGTLPAIVDSSGRRTFRTEDVEKLARERERRAPIAAK
jgi:predicted site-specific integrase-resolvase